MEVECLSLKDLTSPRKSFKVYLEEEDGSEQKVTPCLLPGYNLVVELHSSEVCSEQI